MIGRPDCDNSTINCTHEHPTNATRCNLAGDSRAARSAREQRHAEGAESSQESVGGATRSRSRRSRGGLSTEVHQLVDSRGCPLVVALTADRAGDFTMLTPLLAQLAVARRRARRPRKRPVAPIGMMPTPHAPPGRYSARETSRP
jgi:hypothetical protein